MILGTGCDLVEIERMKKACEKEAFLSRVYTERERRQAGGKASVLAGDFAVKEAVAKVFGTGFRDFMPGDIEVLRDELGKPYVNLYGRARKTARKGDPPAGGIHFQYKGVRHGLCRGGRRVTE